MKRIIALLTLITTALVAAGQGYVTNGFWDNWYLGAGGGGNMGIDKHVVDDVTTYPRGYGIATELYLGKCLTPEFEIKIGMQGINVSCGQSVEDFRYLNGSLLFDVSALATGYREDRRISVVPYIHTGIVYYNCDENFGLGAGIESPIRVKKQLYIVPNLKFLAVHNVGIDALSSFTISLRYYFDKSYWVCYD